MTRRITTTVLTLALACSALADAAVLPAAQTLFVADKASKHPKKMTLKVPIAVNLPGKVAACVEYGHSIEAETTGTVTVKLRIVREESEFSVGSFKGRVRDGHFDSCVDLGSLLREGDTVKFNFVYRKFSRLSKGDGFVVIAGLIPQ